VSSFKPKRVSGADLVAQLSSATTTLPPALPPAPAHRPPPTVQINFKASEAFATLVAREAEKEGSTRRFFARLMRQVGYDVPEADVNPVDTRRRRVMDISGERD
jgi:hypothetical protein